MGEVSRFLGFESPVAGAITSPLWVSIGKRIARVNPISPSGTLVSGRNPAVCGLGKDEIGGHSCVLHTMGVSCNRERPIAHQTTQNGGKRFGIRQNRKAWRQKTMAKSEREKQKKADAKKRQEQKRRATKAKRTETQNTILSMRKNAAATKRILRQKGYDWKHYDFLDSHRDAFIQESQQAVKDHPSLLGVHEIEDKDYFEKDHGPLIASLGHTGLKQLFFHATDVGEDYTAEDRKSNMSGSTTAYHDESGNLRTLILIRKTVKGFPVTDMKYAVKLSALFHELGHVADWEQGIHFGKGDVSVLDAEAYAHEHSLWKLMEGNYRVALATLLTAILDLQKERDYRREVAARLAETELFMKCQECVKTNWSDYLDTEGMSATDLRRAIGSVSAMEKFGQ